MLVDFLEGDADRPLITGRIYNGEQTPDWHSNGLLSGLKSKTYRGSKYNELVFDDATDQERVRLNTEHSKSQLNLGYLIHQNGNHRGAFRGTGFELRTDAYGAIRANEGLYLSSWGQPGASGDQLDLRPAFQQLSTAHEMAESLSQSAAGHNAEPLKSNESLKKAGEDTQSPYGNSEATGGDQSTARGAVDSGGRGQSPGLKAPWLHAAASAGITLSTPESTHLAQGHSLGVTSGEDVSLATGRNLIASASEKISLFVQNAGIKLFAARGKIDIQAQSDNLEATARHNVDVTSSDQKIDLAAAEEILLVSGGAYVRLKGGNIEIHAPGKVDIKGASKSFGAATRLSSEMADYHFGSEGWRLLKQKSKGLWESVKTGWAALPFTGTERETEMARERVSSGISDTAEGIDVLTGPGLFDVFDVDKWRQTGQAWKGVGQNLSEGWNKARERNGTLGGIEWAAAGIAFEAVGGRGVGAVGKAKAYSTAYEMRLSKTSYPGVSRGRHFQEANESLLSNMENDINFANGMKDLGINIERTATGLAPRRPPQGWTWHHELEDGLMRLVPRSQHTLGSEYWDILHPNGYGGYAKWGK